MSYAPHTQKCGDDLNHDYAMLIPLDSWAQSAEYEACLLSSVSPADLAGICAEVLAEGSVEDGYHMYYTSGTTGTPKGVVLSHRIVLQHAVGTIKGGLWRQCCLPCVATCCGLASPRWTGD
jgi:acyl-CoA synthetase (AMP-forming)/AMP-acid ligase II